MIRVKGDPIEWDNAVTKKVTRVTKSVTSAEPVAPGDVCPLCGHRAPMTPAERKRASRARKRAGGPA